MQKTVYNINANANQLQLEQKEIIMIFKITRIACAALLSLFILIGCGTNNGTRTAGNANTAVSANFKSITIAASFYPVYISTLNVAKDIPNVRVINMTKPVTGCLHDYAVTPEDMKNLEGTKFFVINGAGMESFMDKITSQMPHLIIIDASKDIKIIKGNGDEEDNPHLWVSISNAIKQVRNIGDELSSLDPDNAEKYKSNMDIYIKKLESEREKMHNALDGISNRDIITFHEAFPYFAEEFKLDIVGVIEREPGSEPSARELDDTIDKIQRLNVKALFAEPQYSGKAIETIARETGAKVYFLDPAVTGPDDENAYINIMDNNLKSLQEALK
jgi:zinc transport system substrate-binding protein